MGLRGLDSGEKTVDSTAADLIQSFSFNDKIFDAPSNYSNYDFSPTNSFGLYLST